MYQLRNCNVRSPDDLLSFLGRCEPLNQYEMVVLCKGASAKHIIGKSASDDLLVAVLNYVSRTGTKDTHRDELQRMSEIFHNALADLWASMHKDGILRETWLNTHKHLCSVLVDASDIEVVLACNGEYSTVEPQLRRLVAAGPLGASLFGKSKAMVTGVSFAKMIKHEVENLMSKSSIGPSEIQEFRNACHQKVIEFKCGSSTKALPKRDLKMEFLTMSLEMKGVQDPELEIEYYLGAALKMEGLTAKDGLGRYPHEEYILPQRTDRDCKVALAVLKPYLDGRKLGSDLLASRADASIKEVQAAFTCKAAEKITALDRSFAVDVACLSSGCLQETLVKVFEGMVLAALPSETKTIAYAAVVAELEALKEKPIAKMVPAKIFEELETVQETVIGLKSGEAPKASLTTSSNKFYIAAMQKLPFFQKVKVEQAAEGKTKSVELTGAEALKHQFEQIAAKVESKPSSLKIQDFDVFHAFKFLLSQQHEQKLGPLVKEVIKARGGSSSGAASASSDTAPGAGGKGPKSTAKTSNGASKDSKPKGGSNMASFLAKSG